MVYYHQFHIIVLRFVVYFPFLSSYSWKLDKWTLNLTSETLTAVLSVSDSDSDVCATWLAYKMSHVHMWDVEKCWRVWGGGVSRAQFVCRYWMSSHCRSLYSGLSAGLQRQMCFASVRLGLYDSVKSLYQQLLDGMLQLWPVTLSCALHMMPLVDTRVARHCILR